MFFKHRLSDSFYILHYGNLSWACLFMLSFVALCLIFMVIFTILNVNHLSICPFFCFCSVPVLILPSTSCFLGRPLSMCQEQAIGCTQKIQSCLWSWWANLFSPRRPDGHLWISKLIPPDQGSELRFPWWHAVADESKGPLLLTTESNQSFPFSEPWVDQNIRLLPGILLRPTSCVRIFNLQFEKKLFLSESWGCNAFIHLTPPLPQHVKFMGWKVHTGTQKQYISWSYNYFQWCGFWSKSFHMFMWKTQKGLKILNFLLLLVVFKWHCGSEGVNGL